MSILKPQPKPQERHPVTVKLDQSLFELLKAYGRFLASSQEHVMRESLVFAASRDPEFRQWLEHHEPRHLQLLRDRAAEARRSAKAASAPEESGVCQ
jgi:hypothetical protein